MAFLRLMKRKYWILLLVACAVSQSVKQNTAGTLLELKTGKLTSFRLTDPPKNVDDQTQLALQLHAAEKNRKLDSIYYLKHRSDGFNGNVLVAQKGLILYKNSFGYEDYSKRKQLSADSKFELASVSKTFTAVAILKLFQEGKLSLDHTIQMYFPDFPFSNITIENLLSHRSGLPNYVNLFADSVKKNRPSPDNYTIINWFTKSKKKIYVKNPDRIFDYSNTNYCILAAIIEQVTNRKYDEFMRNEIFIPTGMLNTFVITTNNDSINTNRTYSYNAKWQIEKPDFFDNVVGDKGIYSTVDDMYAWYLALTQYKILSPAITYLAFEPRSFEKKGVKNYGLGFRMVNYDDPLKKCIFHNGWWNGYNTGFFISPNDEFVVIGLSNKFNFSVYRIQPVVNVLTGVYEEELTESSSSD